jgi:DNA-binding PadR family transcriptional regulator
VAWKDEQVVTTERQEKGKGTITAVYTLQPDKKTLLVTWRMEHDSLLQPLEVRLAFERVAR